MVCGQLVLIAHVQHSLQTSSSIEENPSLYCFRRTLGYFRSVSFCSSQYRPSIHGKKRDGLGSFLGVPFHTSSWMDWDYPNVSLSVHLLPSYPTATWKDLGSSQSVTFSLIFQLYYRKKRTDWIIPMRLFLYSPSYPTVPWEELGSSQSIPLSTFSP